jgi:Na+-transporting NADH:ubiquinone oxidoreductase subunit B
MILIGGAIILFGRVASWRIVAGVMIGMVPPPRCLTLSARHQPDVLHAVVLASGAGRLCLRHDVYGDGPGLASFTDKGKWSTAC